MKIGTAGLDLIKRYEQGPCGGPAVYAYLCPAGVWTAGWGHTHGVKPHSGPFTLDQMEHWLIEDTRDAEGAINSLVTVPISQNQFDALVSLAFNIGSGNFGRSTLLRLLNKGLYAKAADQFPRWNKSNGIVLDGLTKRRNDEQRLFLTGIGD